MRTPSRDKIIFVLSAALLVWAYGYLTAIERWFPHDHLLRAWFQAQELNRTATPVYLHEPVYDRQGVRQVAPEKMESGLTVITSIWERNGQLTSGLRLIDQEGRVLHEWYVDPEDAFDPGKLSTTRISTGSTDIHGSLLLPKGDVLVNLEYAGTVRLDACSKPRWGLLAGNHHSIARSNDGNFWIPGVSLGTRTASPDHPDGFPGIDHSVYLDRLMKVSPEGETLKTINVLDVLYSNGLERYLAEENQTESRDPTHLNDVEPLPASLAREYPSFSAGDLVVSLRGLDLVLVLDPETERVKWHASGPMILQHDPDFIGDGWIGVFDNRTDGTDRGSMLGGSRILALHPSTDSLRVLFPTSQSEPFYSHHRGKWQLLENGNMLLVEEEAARVVEVDSEGRTIWEWVHSPLPNGMIPPVTKATRVNLTAQEVASWPCSPAAASGSQSGTQDQ